MLPAGIIVQIYIVPVLKYVTGEEKKSEALEECLKQRNSHCSPPDSQP